MWVGGLLDGNDTLRAGYQYVDRHRLKTGKRILEEKQALIDFYKLAIGAKGGDVRGLNLPLKGILNTEVKSSKFYIGDIEKSLYPVRFIQIVFADYQDTAFVCSKALEKGSRRCFLPTQKHKYTINGVAYTLDNLMRLEKFMEKKDASADETTTKKGTPEERIVRVLKIDGVPATIEDFHKLKAEYNGDPIPAIVDQTETIAVDYAEASKAD